MATKPSSSAAAKDDPAPPVSSPKLVPVVLTTTSSPPRGPALVRFRNRMTQLLVIQIEDANGKLHHVEIPAMGSKVWLACNPGSATRYGVDVQLKMRRGYLSMEPVPAP